jgi:hypothetical protein
MVRDKIPENTSIAEIQLLIDKIELQLKQFQVPHVKVSVEDLLEYFSYDAPTGDTTTISDVLENKWFLLHEFIEISELKKKGLPLSIELFYDHFDELLDAHMTATEYEFYLAKQLNDMDWLRKRLPLLTSWLDDTELPSRIHKRCLDLRKKYSL